MLIRKTTTQAIMYALLIGTGACANDLDKGVLLDCAPGSECTKDDQATKPTEDEQAKASSVNWSDMLGLTKTKYEAVQCEQMGVIAAYMMGQKLNGVTMLQTLEAFRRHNSQIVINGGNPTFEPHIYGALAYRVYGDNSYDIRDWTTPAGKIMGDTRSNVEFDCLSGKYD